MGMWYIRERPRGRSQIPVDVPLGFTSNVLCTMDTYVISGIFVAPLSRFVTERCSQDTGVDLERRLCFAKGTIFGCATLLDVCVEPTGQEGIAHRA